MIVPEDTTINKTHMTVVFAMSADGKIADVMRSPARFSSSADLAHLQRQVALADGVLFGAKTLRVYGTTLSVSDPQLLELRSQRGMKPQPVQIVCSHSAQFDPDLRFFRQQIPRWLLTTAVGAVNWHSLEESKSSAFERILVAESGLNGINWDDACQLLREFGIQRLAVLGGGELVASLLAADLIDELWLTICPLILGGATAPTPVGGAGFPAQLAKGLELLAVERINQEVFLHYRRQYGVRLV